MSCLKIDRLTGSFCDFRNSSISADAGEHHSYLVTLSKRWQEMCLPVRATAETETQAKETDTTYKIIQAIIDNKKAGFILS